MFNMIRGQMTTAIAGVASTKYGKHEGSSALELFEGVATGAPGEGSGLALRRPLAHSVAVGDTATLGGKAKDRRRILTFSPP